MGQYKYSLVSTGGSSTKFGNCEICLKHASDVYSQSEQRKYTRPDGLVSFTLHGCNSYFGHQHCLSGKQRNEE